MTSPLVRSQHGVTLLGAAALLPDALEEALSLAPTLVAADGGADAALAAGHVPAAVIGDLDSISPGAVAALPAGYLHQIPEQDSTDFDKALRNIAAPFILGLGFLGARMDHTLAAFTTLVTHPTQRCILIGAFDVCFLAPPEVTLNLHAGTRVSLYPMGPVHGESEGLRWPINGVPLEPNGRIGTSNEASGPVRLRFDARRIVVILPRECLLPALRALVPEVISG